MCPPPTGRQIRHASGVPEWASPEAEARAQPREINQPSELRRLFFGRVLRTATLVDRIPMEPALLRRLRAQRQSGQANSLAPARSRSHRTALQCVIDGFLSDFKLRYGRVPHA